MKVNKREVAEKVAEEFDWLLRDDQMHQSLLLAKLTPDEERWARTNLRWTMIDESTGENLLEPTNMREYVPVKVRQAEEKLVSNAKGLLEALTACADWLSRSVRRDDQDMAEDARAAIAKATLTTPKPVV
jgi:hypothetical protein